MIKKRRLWLSRRMGTYAKFSLKTLKHDNNFNVFSSSSFLFNILLGFMLNLADMGCFYVEEPFVPVLVLEYIYIYIHIFDVGAIFVFTY